MGWAALERVEGGNRGNKEFKLPRTGWCKQESLEAGRWKWLKSEPVAIPADYGLEEGVWFVIDQGIRGVVVWDEKRRPHACMLTTEPSVHYQNITKHNRMPVLVDQVI